MPKPTVSDLLDQASRLADMAVEEASSDDPAMLLNAAGKGWNAANLSMAAVIDHYTHSRPPGTQRRRDEIAALAKKHPRSRFADFRGALEAAFGDLHLRAEEQADYQTKVLRRRVHEVNSVLVPLARNLVEKGVGASGGASKRF